MNLTKDEQKTLDYYNSNAVQWSRERQPGSGSFWDIDLETFHQLLPKGKVLEIGCGSGREAAEFLKLGYEYVGTDMSSRFVEEAIKANPTGKFIQQNVYDLNFPQEYFDGFWTAATLLHIPKNRINEALQNINRVAKQGAIGFISLKEGEGEKVEEETGRLFAFYQLDEFKKILEKCGFEVINSERRFQAKRNLYWLTFFVKKY
jgi:ubiquinone/menaquinone biosynthesis C-methylase UbiE